MSLRLTLFVATALSLSACATVDLNDVATQNGATAAKVADVNVVQRAASKLYTAFSNRGFVAKDSRKKVQSATRVLLKGLETTNVSVSSEKDYVTMASDSQTVLADIRMASNHVEQTTKAAEVYIVMAPAEKSLRKELVSLEKALISSREAETVFEDALIKIEGSADNSDYAAFKLSVDELRDATNAFGDRVREAKLFQVAEIN